MTDRVKVGVVVIGRNEGERLKRCLASILAQHQGPVVYVDSGSSDGSVEHAQLGWGGGCGSGYDTTFYYG